MEGMPDHLPHLWVNLVWIGISTLWPATADRSCPSCGEDGLERLDPQKTYGIRCRGCGFRDESVSAWLLAEEEGPLEEIVLRQRRDKGRERADRGERIRMGRSRARSDVDRRLHSN